MPDKHALLGASSASRWLACTPSMRLCENEPKTVSKYAEEGTEAHAEAERILRNAISDRLVRADVIRKSFPTHDIKLYLDTIADRLEELYDASFEPKLLVETQVDYSDYAPEGFGTADATIISGDTIEIYDLKYGKGIEVSASNNPQLRLYGLGALTEISKTRSIANVVLTIVQPRLNLISREELSSNELKRWGEEFVKPRAALAYKGEGNLVAGDHCRFCPIAGKCRTRAEASRALKPFYTQSANILSQADLGNIIPQLSQLEDWIKAVRSYAVSELLAGREIPGYKLVEGRSIRKYKDDLKIAERLKKEGIPEALIYDKRLISITEMTKLLGAKKMNELIGDLIDKPIGSPTLVSVEDKRPAINMTAAEIFDAIIEK